MDYEFAWQDCRVSGEAENPEHGLLPIGLHHAVRVTRLEPGKTYRYRAVSTRVVKMKSYWPEKGLSTESPVYSFTTFDRRTVGGAPPHLRRRALRDAECQQLRLSASAICSHGPRSGRRPEVPGKI